MGLIKHYIVGNKGDFRHAAKIYCQHPNSINKEIVSCDLMCCLKFHSALKSNDLRLIDQKLNNEVMFNEKDMIHALQRIFPQSQILNDFDIFDESHGHYLLIRKLIPKKSAYSDKNFFEICYYDPDATHLQLISVFKKVYDDNKDSNYDPYAVVKFDEISACYDGNYLLIQYGNNMSEKGINWLNSVFIKKLAKLMLSTENDKKKKRGSLCFTNQVDVINYYKLYEKLKEKYANFLISNWAESTDPQKFVFEDIAIATYLLLVWNGGELPNENSDKQSFIDMGCGNGLLVYLLNSEGHKGIGLDIRRRKIWDTYPPCVILKEEAVIPGPSSVYPNADWLIGNHSDELTAWLPVMALRSGPQCQYFTIPCCPYQLDGRVYQRKNSGTSTYRDFIEYVRGISELAGFDTSIDKLRIPSTKRICLIGRKRSLSPEELSSANERIDRFLQSERGASAVPSSQQWIPGFKVRESTERVRNCTKLPKDVVNGILRSIADRLLEERNQNGEWNRGGSIPIGRLASLLAPEQLQYLKNECKGLQTLIKNQHHAFKVTDGQVSFRTPEEMVEISRRVSKEGDRFKWKQKLCWFHAYHPDGCPLSEEVCSYKHE